MPLRRVGAVYTVSSPGGPAVAAALLGGNRVHVRAESALQINLTA